MCPLYPIKRSLWSGFITQDIALFSQVVGRIGKAGSAMGVSAPSQATNDIQEGADETDEGGSKRLLRSQAAAAAADLERDGDLDRTGWHS